MSDEPKLEPAYDLPTAKLAPPSPVTVTLPTCTSCGGHVMPAYRKHPDAPERRELMWYCTGCEELHPSLAVQDAHGLLWLLCAMTQPKAPRCFWAEEQQ